jgi:putative ATPase
VLDQREERLLSGKDIDGWFDREKSSWGLFMHKTLGENSFLAVKNALEETIKAGPLLWRWQSFLIKAVS